MELGGWLSGLHGRNMGGEGVKTQRATTLAHHVRSAMWGGVLTVLTHTLVRMKFCMLHP